VRYFLQQYTQEQCPPQDWEEEPVPRDADHEYDSFTAMCSDPDGKLRLRDIINHFPLEVEGYNSVFHFRFKLPIPGVGYVWIDLNDIDATVPKSRDGVTCKVRLNQVDGEWLEEKQVGASPDWDSNFGWDATKESPTGRDRDADSGYSRQKASFDTTSSFDDGEYAEEEEEEEEMERVDAQEVMDNLRDLLRDRFEIEDRDHRDCLRSLWEGVFQSEPFPKGIDSIHWTTIGFEDEDPCSELRSTACAVLALHVMGYFCQAYGQDVQRIIVSQTGPTGFSFVQCGFHINTMLVSILAIDDVDRMRPEVMDLMSEPNFFEELFSLCFLMADDRKTKSKTGKEIDMVLHELQADLAKIISRGPTGVIDIRNKLIAAKDATTASTVAAAARDKWKAATTWASGDGADSASKAYSKAKNMFGSMFGGPKGE